MSVTHQRRHIHSCVAAASPEQHTFATDLGNGLVHGPSLLQISGNLIDLAGIQSVCALMLEEEHHNCQWDTSMAQMSTQGERTI